MAVAQPLLLLLGMPTVHPPDPGHEGTRAPETPGIAGTPGIDELRAAVAALTARVEELEATRPPVRLPPTETAAAPLPRLPPLEAVLPPLPAMGGGAAAMESRLGGYWAARIGIVSLVTGLAFFVAHGFDRFGPALKAATGYAIAGVLAAAGHWVTRRYQALGRILVAGGLGVAYYTTYALHHVPSMRLIDSAEVAFTLLAASVVGIIAVAQWMRSETVAGLALFLGLHTGMVSEVGVFTLASGCLLAAGAAFFMARNQWVIVPLSTLAAVYSTLVSWLLGNPLTHEGGAVHAQGHLTVALAFVAVYYATFSLAIALSPSRLPRAAGVAFSLLNWAGAALVGAYELEHHGAGGVWAVFGMLAFTSLLLAAMGGWRTGRAVLFHLHLALVAVNLALSSASALDGSERILSLCGLVAGAAVLARVLDSRALRRTGAAIAAITTVVHLVSSADQVAVGLAVIACLVLHERLARPEERVGRALVAGAVTACAAGVVSALLPGSLVTAAWIGAAGAVFLLGLKLEAIHYRLGALVLAGLACGRLFLHDLSALSAGYRIVSFLIAGALLLGVSFVYTRRGERAGPPPSGS